MLKQRCQSKFSCFDTNTKNWLDKRPKELCMKVGPTFFLYYQTSFTNNNLLNNELLSENFIYLTNAILEIVSTNHPLDYLGHPQHIYSLYWTILPFRSILKL